MKPMNRLDTLVFWLAVILLMPSCSSHIPPEIKQNFDTNPGIAQVLESPENYRSQKIRWGGVILNIENKQDASWLTVLAYPLSDHGKPQDYNQSPGRFIAVVNKFLEPLVYKNDREITVVGKFVRTDTLKVGDFPYQYPVIQVEHHYLWPIELEPSDLDYPPYWWHNPWHYPYYPYRNIP